MDYKEYSKKMVIGEYMWICDFRFNDIDNKPIRHIKPQWVIVVSNADLPKNKKVYYSDIHFKPVKNGKVSSQIIAPFDNTGFRSYTGVSLNIFYNEEDCKQHYKAQCMENLKKFEDEKLHKIAYYNEKIEEIKKEFQ